MLICRWAGGNTEVQNKFRSIINLLNQHLFAQSHNRDFQILQQGYHNNVYPVILRFWLAL